MDSAKIIDISKDDFFAILKSLDNLVEKHGKHEYKTAYNQDVLLGDVFTPIKYSLFGQNMDITFYPLEDVWRQFYKQEIGEFKTLFQIYFLLNGANVFKESDYEKHKKYINKLFNVDLTMRKLNVVEKLLSK